LRGPPSWRGLRPFLLQPPAFKPVSWHFRIAHSWNGDSSFERPLVHRPLRLPDSRGHGLRMLIEKSVAPKNGPSKRVSSLPNENQESALRLCRPARAGESPVVRAKRCDRRRAGHHDHGSHHRVAQPQPLHGLRHAKRLVSSGGPTGLPEGHRAEPASARADISQNLTVAVPCSQQSPMLGQRGAFANRVQIERALSALQILKRARPPKTVDRKPISGRGCEFRRRHRHRR